MNDDFDPNDPEKMINDLMSKMSSGEDIDNEIEEMAKDIKNKNSQPKNKDAFNYAEQNVQQESNEISTVFMIVAFDHSKSAFVPLNMSIFDSHEAANMQVNILMSMCPPMHMEYSIQEQPVRSLSDFGVPSNE
jgi:N-methylhydantoinase B/oxoprolinase/acetone carboxylase alpha subunit